MIRLAVRCSPDQAERVLAELVELVPGGVEEDRGVGYVEYAIYGPPGELPALPDLRAAAGDGLVEIETTEIPDDWADRWRDFHEPVVVGGGRIVVRPSWETDAAEVGAAEIDIVVDPGQAFGTGAHATTKACLELLLELSDRGEAGGALADWGTGSAVLAIAAARLGWSPVTGVDHEAAAVEAARENAARNGVSGDFERLNLREETPPQAPTVVANITAPLLLELAARIASGEVERPRTMVLSGILRTELDRVRDGYRVAGLIARDVVESGDWAALLLRG
ncbi:MAG: 50S ribosomal protein L11 methyltransferase [Solirubrobacterales bacterium]